MTEREPLPTDHQPNDIEYKPHEVPGERPPIGIPGEIGFDPLITSDNKQLEANAHKFLEEHQDIRDAAEKQEQDLVAVGTSRGSSIWKVALATAATSLIAGGIILYVFNSKTGRLERYIKPTKK